MKIGDIKELNIPSTPGSYQFFDQAGKVIYVGKAVDLHSRVFSYFRKSADHSPFKEKMIQEIVKIGWIETETEIEALLLEANLIKKHLPIYNIDKKDDKRFSYIAITADEVPAVVATRKIEKQGKYFGPFTSGTAVKETLKTIRKIWPFCTERKIKNKICFYAQIGRCCGVCGGKVGLKEYREKIIKPISLFLEGKKDRVISDYGKRIKNLEKEIKDHESRIMNHEFLRLRSGQVGIREKMLESKKRELIDMKFQLLNMQNVLAHARVVGLGEKYAADVAELAKLLGLPRVPERIEGYDISNIFGKEAVGSMVVFANGEPDKNEYRKFKIRLPEGEANDVGMLKEVLERRVGHLVGNNQETIIKKYPISNIQYPRLKRIRGNQKINKVNQIWSRPDLVIIDGGRAQLNAGVGVLRKFQLDIPIISVSKGEGLRGANAPDKIFFPGESKPLELPLASPALHIIKRVRDEAHRFAIQFHRQRRQKDWLK